MTKETIDETMARLGLTSEEDRAFLVRHEAMHEEMREILDKQSARNAATSSMVSKRTGLTRQEVYEALCASVAED
jgi:hypothetical protein